MKYKKIDYTVNGKKVSVKVKKFKGKLSIARYKSQIYNALEKIGIKEDYISVNHDTNNRAYAEVRWEINNKHFSFRCDMFDTETRNLGAVAQAITDDVRHITRGIKSLWATMRQYEALPAPEDVAGDRLVDYSVFSVAELKRLLQANHPDTAKDFDKEKFANIKRALDKKRGK